MELYKNFLTESLLENQAVQECETKVTTTKFDFMLLDVTQYRQCTSFLHQHNGKQSLGQENISQNYAVYCLYI